MRIVRDNSLYPPTHRLSCLVVRSPLGMFVCWLLNVPATSECISGTDLLGQFNVLPH